MKVGTLIKEMYENIVIYKGIFKLKDTNEVYLKIIHEVHQNKTKSNYIMVGIYYILGHMACNYNKINEETTDENEKNYLYTFLDELKDPLIFSKLLDWARADYFAQYGDYYPLPCLEEVLKKPYRDFITEVGNSLIEALIKYSE